MFSMDRYETKEMRAIWSEQAKYKLWLDLVNSCLGEEATETNGIPMIKFIEECKKKEETTKHDVAAFLEVAERYLNNNKVGLGMTSSDIVDTANNFMLVSSVNQIYKSTDSILAFFEESFLSHKEYKCLARTHTMPAGEVSLSSKMRTYSNWIIFADNLMLEAAKKVGYAKFSGPLGDYANIDRKVEIEMTATMYAGDVDSGKNPPHCFQCFPRARYANLMDTLGTVAVTLEAFIIELRQLAQPEIGEVKIGWSEGRVGSSSMPHKKNPVSLETVQGLLRHVRSLTSGYKENVLIWGYRDMTHSAPERMVFPEVCTLLHYSVNRLSSMLIGGEISFDTDRMLENLRKYDNNSHEKLSDMVKRGASRSDAHKKLRNKER